MMFGSSACAYGIGYSIWMYSKNDAIVWGLLAVFLIGSSAKYFADGCIAQDHPFSQFALWGKLLAFGLIVEVSSGVLLGAYLTSHYSEAGKLAGALSLPSFIARYAPSLCTAAVVLETWLSIRLLVARVLFLRRPALSSIITLLMWAMTGAALQPIWMLSDQRVQFEQKNQSKSEPQKKEISRSDAERRWRDDFWRPVLGDHYWPPLIVAWVLGFIIAEILNQRMRRRDEVGAVFRATVWPSFPICYGSPLLGAAGARYILVWMKVANPWLFGALSISFNAIAATIGTSLIIRIYLSNLKASRSSSVSRRGRRQELLLFLRLGTIIRGEDHVSRIFAHAAHEMELALEYSGAGRIEGYSKQDDFFIVQMAGSSAELMLQTLHDLLDNISIAPGSFAVVRYGDGSQEKMIEL